MSIEKLVRYGLLAVLMTTLAACATAKQREAAMAPVFAKNVYPRADLLEQSPEHGEQRTVGVNKAIYREKFGPKEGARLLADLDGENLFYSYTASKGDVFSAFGQKGETGEKIYCTTGPLIYSALSGKKGGCLIDKTGDGTFDEVARFNLKLDTFTSMGPHGDLVPAVPYEPATIEEPEFVVDMIIYYRGMEDGRLQFSSGGVRTKGADLPNDLLKTDEDSIAAVEGDQVYRVNGVKMTIHKATSTEITYTVDEGSFETIQYLNFDHLVPMRYRRGQ